MVRCRRLKDRKAKRKTKGSGKAEEAPDFFMAENGRIRPSDMGGPEDFKQLDKVRFGETAERPPDLSAFTGRKARQQAVVHPLYTGGEQSAQSAGSKFIERQKMRETREQFLAKEAEAKPVMKNGSLSLKELVRAQEAARQAYAALRQKRLQGAAK